MVDDPVAVVAACASVVTFLLGLLVHDFLVLYKEMGQWIGGQRSKVGAFLRSPERPANAKQGMRTTVESVLRDGAELVRSMRFIGLLGVVHLTLSMIWFLAYLNGISLGGYGVSAFPLLAISFLGLWLRWLYKRTTELGQDFDKLKREAA